MQTRWSCASSISRMTVRRTFATVLVRAGGAGHEAGRLTVNCIGPGDARWLTPQADAALATAEAIYGYAPIWTGAGPVRADGRA